MEFSAVLLTGGRSSRMGRDKALLEFEGKSLWRHQLAKLRALLPNELFIAGPQRAPGAESIRDAIAGAGPLGGVSAALRKCASSRLLVLALDLPLMSPAFLESLLALCEPGRGVVPNDGTRFEPLAAIYPKSCAPLAADALAGRDFSMQNFVRAAIKEKLLVARRITAEEARLFANLNTPADLAAL